MITLQEAKVGMVNKIDQAVVDEFRRGSFLLDKMTFDDCISPGTGGSNLVYSYQKYGRRHRFADSAEVGR